MWSTITGLYRGHRREGDQQQELVEGILSIVDDSQHEQEPHVPGLQCRSRGWRQFHWIRFSVFLRWKSVQDFIVSIFLCHLFSVAWCTIRLPLNVMVKSRTGNCKRDTTLNAFSIIKNTKQIFTKDDTNIFCFSFLIRNVPDMFSGFLIKKKIWSVELFNNLWGHTFLEI